jgi:hypothetical protein
MFIGFPRPLGLHGPDAFAGANERRAFRIGAPEFEPPGRHGHFCFAISA